MHAPGRHTLLLSLLIVSISGVGAVSQRSSGPRHRKLRSRRRHDRSRRRNGRRNCRRHSGSRRALSSRNAMR